MGEQLDLEALSEAQKVRLLRIQHRFIADVLKLADEHLKPEWQVRRKFDEIHRRLLKDMSPFVRIAGNEAEAARKAYTLQQGWDAVGSDAPPEPALPKRPVQSRLE